VVVAESWPDDAHWPDLLDRVAGLDPGRWDALHDRAAAHRFADALARLAP
jgi:hypothetical protein